MKRGRESALCVDGGLMVKEGFAGLFILGGCLILRHPGVLMERFNGKQETPD